MKKVYLSYMTWPEVVEVARSKPTVIVPAGTTEAQNLHNPMGYDYLIARDLAEAAAQRCNAVIAPVIPYGYSEIFTRFPGTISLQFTTLQAIFEDVIRSLIKSGFDHILFINNHEPNHAPLANAVNAIRDETGIICASIWPTTLARVYAQDLFDNPTEVLVHGNEPSTSLLMYLHPDMMRMDLAKAAPPPGKFQNFNLASASTIEHMGQKVHLFLRMHDVSQQGGWGDPKGDAIKGKIIFEKMVEFIVTFVERFNELDTRIKD